ncbi:MAG: hypothetical protein Q9194_000292 [Teloschistes cf. exilis]
MSGLAEAIAKLHRDHRIPHVIVTSIRFDPSSPVITVVGSSSRTDGSPRLFKIDVPALDCFFSGTGDMFAALIVVRLREAVSEQGLSSQSSWRSPDEVEAVGLPLATATEKVLGSMHTILEKTKIARDAKLGETSGPHAAFEQDSEKRLHLRKTKAAEVRLVQNMGNLRKPDRTLGLIVILVFCLVNPCYQTPPPLLRFRLILRLPAPQASIPLLGQTWAGDAYSFKNKLGYSIALFDCTVPLSVNALKMASTL